MDCVLSVVGSGLQINHTCPDQVPIHVLEELWDALEIQTNEDGEEIQSEILTTDETIMVVQEQLNVPKFRRQTLKLLARICDKQVLVLVDSGSIGTFISSGLVQKLGLSTKSCQQAMFKAADGGHLQCSKMVPHLEWWVQGHTFVSTAKVLEVRCYNMIVGEDWLEAVSPVQVDYILEFWGRFWPAHGPAPRLLFLSS
jgi:hypothetical protein